MKSSASNIKLEKYGNLFGNNEIPIAQRVGGKEQVVEIPLDQLQEFNNHPFKVLDDEKMDELVESIKANGVLVPGIVREISKGKYEIISGHRRKHASQLAGLEKMPVVIKELSDEESTVIMVDANIQRETILPSEKARAYKMKYDALKHQGKKGECNTYEVVGESTGDSVKTVQRYIQLSRLIDGLLDMVDNKQLGFIQGIEIALLKEEQQKLVLEVLNESKVSMSKEQATKIKDYGKKGELSKAIVDLVLGDVKSKETKVVIKAKTIKEYFPENTSENEIEEIIIGLLNEWKNRQ